MHYDHNSHHRKSIRLNDYDYSQEGIYFVTICTKNMECVFGDVVDGEMVLNEYGEIVKHCWYDLPKHFPNVALDEHIIMPNHFHAIVKIIRCRGLINQTPTGNHNQTNNKWILQKNPFVTLGKTVRTFKSKSSYLIHNNNRLIFRWQRNYYDRIILSEAELYFTQEYIKDNPANWGFDRNNPKNIQDIFRQQTQR